MPDRSGSFGATDVLLLLMATIWGINYSAVKYAGLAFGSLTFTWMRVLIAMLTLLTAVALQRKALPARRDVLRLLGLGVIGNGLYQLLFVFGVARTRVGSAALILAAAPAFIALLSWARGLEKISSRAWGGIALSIAGVGIVMLGSASSGSAGASAAVQHNSAIGVLLVFSGVICWSVYTVWLQPLTHRVDPVQLSAFTMAGGMIPLAFATPVAVTSLASVHVTQAAWWCLAYSSVISIGIAYLFWYRGLRILGPTRTSIYGNLQPIVAILTGWVALGETPTVWQLAGTVAIIGGIFLTRA
ncbi:MAG: DMT family transporter [Gemmatimonadaceae bacterium]